MSNPTHAISQAVLRAGGRRFLAREAGLTITGREHIPTAGPCVLVAHHYHHLLDGCALYMATGRPLHVLVGLDWAGSGLQRRGMEALCRMAGWPVITRPGALGRAQASNEQRTEAKRLMRRAMRSSVALLADGQIVVVFPEGYPVIDPHGSPKQASGESFLTFEPGVVRLVRIAESRGKTIPMVPIGFVYERADDGRWRIDMHIGKPIRRVHFNDDDACLGALEKAVRKLSEDVLRD
ncbi:MAG: 1-acyl-sn-glycerol-3-phosphate acyltransferase [Chloroflexia bacterium]|nr:1-acyl-sn-glycerol-3-phosphate acyltransferase [Chloroflexia bacterium]